MKLPQEVNLLIDEVKHDKYLLEWQLFGNSNDDVRLELKWRRVDALLHKGKNEEWKLKKSSQPMDEPPKRFADVAKTTFTESSKTSGTEDARESVASAVKHEKSTKEVDGAVEGKDIAVADSQSDAASRRLRLQKSKASLDSNIACSESTKRVLEKKIAREDSFTKKGGKKSPFRKLKKDEKLPSTSRLHLSLSVDHIDAIIPHENNGSIVHSVVRKILGESKADVKAKSQENTKSDPKRKIENAKLENKVESKSEFADAKLASRADGKRESKGDIVETRVTNQANGNDEAKNARRQIVKEKKCEASSKENSFDVSSPAESQDAKVMNLVRRKGEEKSVTSMNDTKIEESVKRSKHSPSRSIATSPLRAGSRHQPRDLALSDEPSTEEENSGCKISFSETSWSPVKANEPKAMCRELNESLGLESESANEIPIKQLQRLDHAPFGTINDQATQVLDHPKAESNDSLNEECGNSSRRSAKSTDPAKEISCADKEGTEENSSQLELSNGEAERQDTPRRKGRHSWKFDET